MWSCVAATVPVKSLYEVGLRFEIGSEKKFEISKRRAVPIGGLATARMVPRRRAAKTNQTFIIDNLFQIANNPITFSPLYVAKF